jgi:hypothetical protein
VSPFDLVASLPGLSAFRATARFGLLVTFACAALAAIGVASLRTRFPAAKHIIPVVAAVLVLGEVFVVDFPPGRPVPQPLPEMYRVARADGARAAVALPMYAGQPQWFFEGDYLLYSTAADFLPLANGIGRWVPPEYVAMGAATAAFPSEGTAAALRLYGITHVLLHGARYGRRAPAVLERARNSPDFAIVWSGGSDTLFRVLER